MTTENNKKESEIPMLGAEGVVKFRKELNFGDTIINGYASERNPHRSGIVVRVKEKSIQATDGKGDFWEIVLDKESRLKLSSAPATSIEGEIKSKEEILKEIVGSAYFTVNEGGTVLVLQIDALKAMEAYASQFTASKEKEYREALEKIEVEFCFMFPYGQQKGGGAYNLSSPIIIPQEKLPLIKKAIEDILNK